MDLHPLGLTSERGETLSVAESDIPRILHTSMRDSRSTVSGRSHIRIRVLRSHIRIRVLRSYIRIRVLRSHIRIRVLRSHATLHCVHALCPRSFAGSKFEKLCDEISVTLNKNSIYGDRSAMSPGGEYKWHEFN